MCVALMVVGPKPSLSDLQAMEKDNPHGAGLAYAGKRGVQYRRGLTAEQIHDLLDRLPRPVLIHFRWATHGGVRQDLIHPFPLGTEAFTGGINGTASLGVLIHNGVWSGFRQYMPRNYKPDDVSDTQVAAWVAAADEDILDRVAWSTAVGRMVRGRMEVRLRGDWEHYAGVMYSNTKWRPTRKYVTTRNYPYGHWDTKANRWVSHEEESGQHSWYGQGSAYTGSGCAVPKATTTDQDDTAALETLAATIDSSAKAMKSLCSGTLSEEEEKAAVDHLATLSEEEIIEVADKAFNSEYEDTQTALSPAAQSAKVFEEVEVQIEIPEEDRKYNYSLMLRANVPPGSEAICAGKHGIIAKDMFDEVIACDGKEYPWRDLDKDLGKSQSRYAIVRTPRGTATITDGEVEELLRAYGM